MRFFSSAGAAVLGTLVILSLGNPAHPRPQQAANSDAQTLPSASPISGQVTFLYCNDLAKGSEFYSKLLGKKPSLDMDWVKIYPVTETFSVGLVDKDHGSLRPSPSKPVMLSFIVQNPKQVDEWYARLKALGAEIRSQPKWEEPKNGRRLYSLSFKDPEGYILEVFSWVD
jgi:catechol 2,3-dioxygenase-like lactoylglutathione lyase family enzyme